MRAATRGAPMTTPTDPTPSRSHRRRFAALAGAVVVLLGGAVAVGVGMTHEGGSPGAAPSPSTTAGTAASTGMAGTPVATSAMCGDVPGAMQMDDGMVMAGVPARAPTATDRAHVVALVRKVTTGIGRYASL